MDQGDGQCIRAYNNIASALSPQLAGQKGIHDPLGMVGIDIDSLSSSLVQDLSVFKPVQAPDFPEAKGNRPGKAPIDEAGKAPPDGVCVGVAEPLGQGLGFDIGSGKVVVYRIAVGDDLFHAFPAVSRSIRSIASMHFS